MKKFLILIIGLILFCSCGPEKSKQQKEMERYELTFKDEHGENRTHQFVSVRRSDYMNGIAHWPDCKYCKERGL